MHQHLWTKMAIGVITIIFLLFAGFIGLVFTWLAGLLFYMPVVVIVTLGMIVFLILGLFKLVKPSTLRKWIIAFVALCIAVIGSYEIYKGYHNSIPTLTEQDVDLYDYQPFREGTKAVTLDDPATLQIKRELPVLDGATALYPLYAAFVQATYPEKEYDIYDSEVMCNQTTGAYKNLINGEVDIIFAAGPSEAQLRQAEERGVELKLTPIGREAFVFFVNKHNPVKGLTIEEIQPIYSGEITNWKEAGGNDEPIRAFQRPPDSGSQTALEKLMGDIPLMEPPTENVVAGMGSIIENTADYRNYRNALGYSFRYFATEMVNNGDIRFLEIEGVYPDKETIRSGEYPLAAEFYAITAGSDNPHVEALIDWILSEQGQYFVEKTGYVPVHNH
ncbi:phosphate transport system substrate-binding protein [Caldalkalibacillus uzonensis]|uniref:Phosphate transport system substrate-binding protein n=1 Tax=Caldalkalibacillus uzonensis TaxID=353224 RepID=A0ABU0CQL1_9BACI|nr:substrate-binding domain-containing protein [Caldalkalibacillus uzonensis]MDQ0338442.1 phosphate transport system substrate-binding protein [Caldalkalibacillus uzonensis]